MTDSEFYLYRLQVTRPAMLTDGPTDEEQAVRDAHFNYVKDLTEKGVVLLAGRTQVSDYSSFGIVIFRAASLAAADELMRNDPAVKERVMRAELYPFRVALLGRLQ